MGDNQSTEAWFTDDIPISVGPYEYGGLPGAILELNEGNGMIKYVATEIKSLTKEPSILLPKQFINVTKENYDKISNE
jgi:GLPGLI family protein